MNTNKRKLDDAAEDTPTAKRIKFSINDEPVTPQQSKPPTFPGTISPAKQNLSVPKDYKVMNDSLYGHVRIGKDIWQFIDTPQFQRLRDLKQLGVSYYVYPGASHNRLEHSIGVSYLAGEWITHFKTIQPELEISDNEVFLVRLAGLCHDLGHGPFSHVFDNEFLPKRLPNTKWKHEQGSITMFKYLLEDNKDDLKAYGLELDDHAIETVIHMINGSVMPGLEHRKFLFQIVANQKNGIDVDKLDYLARDAQLVGLPFSYNPRRLIEFSRVFDGEICFHAKEAFNLYKLYQTRYDLHRTVYQHRTTKSIEYMVIDAMLHADPVLNISGAIHDKRAYMLLTDCVLKKIEETQDEKLKTAQAIVRRLRKRQLYKLVHEILVPSDRELKLTIKEILEQSGESLQETDIIVQNLQINYAKGKENPLHYILFYDEHAQKFPIDKNRVSLTAPQHFYEVYIRIFVRDPNHSSKASVAFKKWTDKQGIQQSAFLK